MSSDVIPKYCMERGLRRAVIINNVHFQPRPMARHVAYPTRDYSAVDVANLYPVLRALNFAIEIHNDKTARQMTDIANHEAACISAGSTGSVQCFLLLVLSYGEFGLLEGVDTTLSADALIKPFKGDTCKTLAGKPKIFIFQACCPDLYSIERLHGGHVVADDDAVTRTNKTYKIPGDADFHITWSLVPGNLPSTPSCDIRQPSLFLYNLIAVLNDECAAQRGGQAAQEYQTLLTKVLRRVDARLEAIVGTSYVNLDLPLPATINMLTKALYFPVDVTV